MEGSSSAPTLPSNFAQLRLSSRGSTSSSSLIQNANMVTPKEGELPGTQTVAMEGSSSAPPLLIDFIPQISSGPGSSSSSLLQSVNMVMPPERELSVKDTGAMEGWSSAPAPLLEFPPLLFSRHGSSFSSPGTQTVAIEGSSSALPLLIDFIPHLSSDPGSSSSSLLQSVNMVTPRERELSGKGLKRKRSSGSVVPNNNGRPVPRNNEEENHHAGISTELVLYEDKCTIKKKLTKSDLDNRLSRLMLSRSCVEADVLPLMDEEMKEQVKSRNGMKVVVRNADTHEEHELVFRRWGPSGSYVLNCGWTKLFVKERGLKVGDEIGMFWDTDDRKFHFTVHRKVARGASNAVA